jgi:hypothetical protein
MANEKVGVGMIGAENSIGAQGGGEGEMIGIDSSIWYQRW